MSGVNTLKERTENLKIAKTIKLFIGGEFPRTESGRSAPVYLHKTKKLYANVCVASRKDLRNAVTAAQGAQKGWQSKSAYNRSQILYRMAEMLEAKREEFTEALTATLGLTPVQANKSVDASIEALVYYSGFADKYQQVLGAVNPVSGPHHNFTSTEAVGVVGLIANEKFDLAAFVAQLAAIIVSGNTVVALMSENGSALLAPLAETLATSDLSKGVVNLLTGSTEELYKQFGLHMEIQSLSVQLSDAKKLGELKVLAADNMKRVVNPTKDSVSLEHLMSFVEFKTVWHPIGY
jgi:acyl-CoA reductase-like NAD-dependent aldehyde dehydrogenase